MALILASGTKSGTVNIPLLDNFRTLQNHAESMTQKTITGVTIGDYYIISGCGSTSDVTFSGADIVSRTDGAIVVKATATTITVNGNNASAFGAIAYRLIVNSNPSISNYQALQTYAQSLGSHTITGATKGDYYLISGNNPCSILVSNAYVIGYIGAVALIMADDTSFTVNGGDSGMLGAYIFKLTL